MSKLISGDVDGIPRMVDVLEVVDIPGDGVGSAEMVDNTMVVG